MLSVTSFLRKNYTLEGSQWARILFPLIWRMQYTFSPTFAPRTLWKHDGEEIDRGETEASALNELILNNPGYDDDEIIECPVCDRFTIALQFGFPEVNGRERISIEEMHCVNCNLELGSSPLDQLMSEALLDTFLTENEPRLRAAYGLK